MAKGDGLGRGRVSVDRIFPARGNLWADGTVRRAAVSIPSNIAEGQGRNSTSEFINFLSFAYGSLCEVETQILLAERLAFLDSGVAATLLQSSAEVGRIVNGLSNSLRPAT